MIYGGLPKEDFWHTSMRTNVGRATFLLNSFVGRQCYIGSGWFNSRSGFNRNANIRNATWSSDLSKTNARSCANQTVLQTSSKVIIEFKRESIFGYYDLASFG